MILQIKPKLPAMAKKTVYGLVPSYISSPIYLKYPTGCHIGPQISQAHSHLPRVFALPGMLLPQSW